MVSWKRFTFVISKVQCKLKFKVKVNFVTDTCTYLHQIKSVEFIYDSHGQIFLFTLYVLAVNYFNNNYLEIAGAPN